MNELRNIINAYDKAMQHNLNAALATVVKVDGSSYRKAGARMLITDDGQFTGAISGGCLEGDALRKARYAISQNRPMLVTYDTTDEDDAQMGVGLGCNGIIHVLIEPIDKSSDQNAVELFRRFFLSRQYAVVATLFSLENKQSEQPGTCLFLTDTELIKNSFNFPESFQELISDSNAALKDRQSLNKEYESSTTAFIEVLKPELSLVIFGAGNDAIPLVKMASILGWRTIIIDGRANYATEARFPNVSELIVSKADNWKEQVAADERTAFVLMTHNYIYDQTVLNQLLRLNVPYIGCLGPRKRLNKMLFESGYESGQLPENLYGPAGLDLMAENSEEIALSILSEIQAVFNHGRAGFLRYKESGIHTLNLSVS